MQKLRRVPVHRSLTRHQLVMGCDRELFFMLTLLCGLLGMSGLMQFYWPNIVLGIVLWICGTAVLARLAVYDPNFKGILMRSMRYKQNYLPLSSKRSGAFVKHERW